MTKYEVKEHRPEGNHDVQLTSFHETRDGLVIRNSIIDLNNRLNPSETIDNKSTNHQGNFVYLFI